MSDPTITLSAPAAQYLLALSLDPGVRSERMDAYVRPLLADVLFPGNGEFIGTTDAPLLAREAFAATIWKEGAA